MNFTKKFLFIFFIICLLFFSFIGFSTNKVFASSVNEHQVLVDGVSYSFTYSCEDECPYFYIFRYSNGNLTFVCSSVPLVITSTKISNFVGVSSDGSAFNGCWLTFSGPTLEKAFKSLSSYHHEVRYNIESVNFSINPGDVVISSNYDLKKVNGDLVFQPAPHKEGILTPIATSMDFSQVMTEVLQILPMMLLILISLIGLMKAIKLLFKVLRQS